MKSNNPTGSQPNSAEPKTPVQLQPSNPAPTVFRYGGMRIPPSLVFYEKDYVYAMVPLAQKLQGHIMLVPKRQVLNIKDLTAAEVFDLGLAIKFLSKELELFHNTASSTVYVQNYGRIDDKINHMCVHLIARKKGDFTKNDDIYSILNAYDKDFLLEYNQTIANGHVFSEAKVEQLGLIAYKYKTTVDKALLEIKSLN